MRFSAKKTLTTYLAEKIFIEYMLNEWVGGGFYFELRLHGYATNIYRLRTLAKFIVLKHTTYRQRTILSKHEDLKKSYIR
jgi:hypothetical protein